MSQLRSTRPALPLAVLAGVIAGCAETRPITKGEVAPPWTLPDTAGVQRALADYRGSVVLMDFWASWCAPCRRAGPVMQTLADRYADDGLVVLCFQHQDDADPRPYIDEHGYTYTFLPDADAVARAYGAGLPSFVVVGRDGRVVLHKGGFGHGTDVILGTAIERALGDRAPAAIGGP